MKKLLFFLIMPLMFSFWYLIYLLDINNFVYSNFILTILRNVYFAGIPSLLGVTSSFISTIYWIVEICKEAKNRYKKYAFIYFIYFITSVGTLIINFIGAKEIFIIKLLSS